MAADLPAGDPKGCEGEGLAAVDQETEPIVNHDGELVPVNEIIAAYALP